MNLNHTKAERLSFLIGKLKGKSNKNFKILDLIYFKKSDYIKNKNKITAKIEKKFKNKKIIIRSSALNEDKYDKSLAGKFSSFSNISVNKKDLHYYLEKLIHQFKNPKDQVLVQEFINKPEISGVIFTRETNYNSPYYQINYDKSGKTDVITSGKYHPTIKNEIVFKKTIFASKEFFGILKIVEKLEKILKSDRLDIEFAKKNKIWYLFQCRNLPQRAINFKKNDNVLEKVLVNLEKKIKKLKKINPTLSGKTTYFSNMSDWNPAEMIGSKPKPLSISLYSELITNSVWATQRKNYGYKNVAPNILMINLAGSPYIDMRTDFNSFLPNNIPKKIEKKIIESLLKNFSSKTFLHDKIEFDLIPTCYDFLIKKNENLDYLTNNEKELYFLKLKDLTNNLFEKKNDLLNYEINKFDVLNKKINEIKISKLSEIQKIFFLIDDCKNFGTLPFSGIARLAFIFTSFLRSFKKLKILNQEEIENIYSNTDTVTKHINRESLKALESSKLKKSFLAKYGHLRPSTYSLSSLNYNEGFNIYFPKIKKNNVRNKIKNFNLSKKKIIQINSLFKKHKLKINAQEFFKFLKESIKYREYGKFIFSKSINEIFLNLIKLGKEVKIKRDDLEYINIKTILSSYNNLEPTKLQNILKKEIIKNKKDFEILKNIKLSDVIKNSKEVYVHQQTLSKGNYITSKKVNGQIYYIRNQNFSNNLENKIILIDNADPGYDFIFNRNIKGLVTKYGGANSHMAIRCLELKIPAIIGLGPKNFDQIKNKKMLEFDCEQKTFTFF